jgi:hypothetical protein
MGTSRAHPNNDEPGTAALPGLGNDPMAETPAPWEQIASGRYMPRRIRGSCRGRELG